MISRDSHDVNPEKILFILSKKQVSRQDVRSHLAYARAAD